MSIHPVRLLGAILLAALFTGSGCGEKAPEIPAPLAAEAAPTTLTEAFASATGETKEMANDAITYLSANDYEKALLVLQRLLQQADLTPDQRNFTSQALLTANEKVSEAAAKGNERAVRLQQQREFAK